MKSFAMSMFGCVALLAVAASTLQAEVNEKILADVYNQGLKAFYAGQYTQAHDTLSQAIEGGSKDPRTFYIRGVANLRLGRQAAAKADFEHGAAIEGKDFDLFYNASSALERIQGPERRMLESYRAAGRKNAIAEIEKIRFEHFRRFDPAEGVVGSATTGSTGAPAAGATDPNAAPTGTAPAANPFGAPTAPANPFGAPTAPAAPATPAGGNPFGAPATPPPAAAPPAAAPPTNANPFGT
jgi:hypothetical protein